VTPKTEKLFEKIEKSHEDLLKRIDKLDRQVEEVLKNWTDPASVLNLSDSAGNGSAVSADFPKAGSIKADSAVPVIQPDPQKEENL